MQGNDGLQKGLRTILIEREKWRHKMKLKCDACKERGDVIDPELHDTLPTDCCAFRAVSCEKDFQEQKEWLTETVEKAGFSIIFYPKYHCEFNYIENIWSYIKQFLRKHCTYNYSDLKAKLPEVINDLSNEKISYVRKMASHAYKFMELYRRGLDGPLLDYAIKKYRGHRSIPIFVTEHLQSELNKKKNRT
jgi:hypothetical protein